MDGGDTVMDGGDTVMTEEILLRTVQQFPHTNLKPNNYNKL